MKGNFAAVSRILGVAVNLLLYIHHVDGVEGEFGPCPALTLPTIAADPFGVASTNWFEVRRLPSAMEKGLKCVRYAFDASTVVAGAQQHTLTIVGTKEVDRTTVIITDAITQTPAGVAASSFNQWTARLQSTASGSNIFQARNPTTFSVLGTDGFSWIVLYSCSTVGLINIRTSVILTTTVPPTAAQLAAAYAAASMAGIRTEKYIAIDQSTC